MIRSFIHKGLRRYFSDGVKSGIQSAHAEKLKLILGWLGSAVEPKDMNLPGLNLHPLKGDRKGTWSVWFNGNWRVTFSFEGKDAKNVDYEDYH